MQGYMDIWASRIPVLRVSLGVAKLSATSKQILHASTHSCPGTWHAAASSHAGTAGGAHPPPDCDCRELRSRMLMERVHSL